MSASLILFRNGLKSSQILRPYSSIRSVVVGKNLNLIKQQKPVLSSQVAGLSSQPGEVQVRHKHPIQWNYEHYVTIALMGLIPTALVAESPIVDSVLAVTLCTHIFWGLECVITDYVHGATLPKLAMGALYAVMALTLTGLLYFNYKDIGISRAVKKVWAL